MGEILRQYRTRDLFVTGTDNKLNALSLHSLKLGITYLMIPELTY